MSCTIQQNNLPTSRTPTRTMMDEIDFELCLNVDQVTPPFHREKRKQYNHNNTTNSTNNNKAIPRVRTHDELGDSTADESAITPVPPAKRARISQSEGSYSYQRQSTNVNTGHQGTGSLVDSSPLFGHYTGFFSFGSYQQGPIPVPRRAMSEDMDIDMMYMGSETETGAEIQTAPESFHGQCPIHSFGAWSNSNGSGSFGGGLGSFSSQRNNSASMFPIYEEPADMDMEIEGVFRGEDWYSSPDEDKENVENGHEQGSILQEGNPNSVAVYQRG